MRRFKIRNLKHDKYISTSLTSLQVSHHRPGLYGDVRCCPDYFDSIFDDRRGYRALFHDPDTGDVASNRICDLSGFARNSRHGGHDLLTGYGDCRSDRIHRHADAAVPVRHSAFGERRAGNNANDLKSFHFSSCYNCNCGPTDSCNNFFAKRYIRSHIARYSDNSPIDADNNERKRSTSAGNRRANIF